MESSLYSLNVRSNQGKANIFSPSSLVNALIWLTNFIFIFFGQRSDSLITQHFKRCNAGCYKGHRIDPLDCRQNPALGMKRNSLE